MTDLAPDLVLAVRRGLFGPVYHDMGNGLLFCRLCLCAFLPCGSTDADPHGTRLHERSNPRQHEGG